jgi:hypothetical protein
LSSIVKMSARAVEIKFCGGDRCRQVSENFMKEVGIMEIVGGGFQLAKEILKRRGGRTGR